jgi:benzoyl-CoA reductase subunit C
VLDEAKKRPARRLDNVRVVVVGSFCEQPPIDLIVTLERAGCDIVADDLQLGMRMIEGSIDEDGDPVEALAMAYVHRGAATASRYIGDLVKGRALVERVKSYRAEGVVFAAASFCDPALLDQPMLESALQREGIAFTTLKYAENTGQFQTIREQAGAFSDSVKLWGGAA